MGHPHGVYYQYHWHLNYCQPMLTEWAAYPGGPSGIILLQDTGKKWSRFGVTACYGSLILNPPGLVNPWWKAQFGDGPGMLPKSKHIQSNTNLQLVGGFNPSEKYESQWEGLSHILWKNVWNHQPARIDIRLHSSWYPAELVAFRIWSCRRFIKGSDFQGLCWTMEC